MTRSHPWLVLLIAASAACSGSNDGGKDEELAADALADTVGACQEGQPCDDGDPCTTGDLCAAGTCAGTPLCPTLPCAEFTCADGQCTPAVHPGMCVIANACQPVGTPSPDNSCLTCNPEVDPLGWSEAPTGTACQDGNICTEEDYCDHGDCLPGTPPSCPDGVDCTSDECDPETGCLHTPHDEECLDDNPCTKDACDPEAGCTNVPDDTLICSDTDVCTLNDHCQDGQCLSDPDPLDCNDNNACTDELCHAAYGCMYLFNEIPCDDGATCTTNDVCHFGKCLGTEEWPYCPACWVEFDPHVAKLVSLRVGDGGHPGEAINVDGDLKSCSPEGDCELGLDNSLSFAGELVDQVLKENLEYELNPLIFVAELKGFAPGVDAITLNVYYAYVSDSDPECDYMSQTCAYVPGELNFGPLCDPQISFTNAKVAGDTLKGGGSGFIFPFDMTFSNGESAEMVFYNAGVEAKVITDPAGNVLMLKGVLGGAVTQEDLEELVKAVPEGYITPEQKEGLIGLFGLLPKDIDLDGDGTGDGCSIALVFETIPAVLEPYQEW